MISRRSMVLEGVVPNVSAFRAFVGVGVHVDGLGHVSTMSKTFVKDPRAVLKPGDIAAHEIIGRGQAAQANQPVAATRRPTPQPACDVAALKAAALLNGVRPHAVRQRELSGELKGRRLAVGRHQRTMARATRLPAALLHSAFS